MTIEGRIVETRIKNEPKVPISLGAENAGSQQNTNEDAKLYVAFLPPHYEESDIKELFSPYGLVQSVKLVCGHSTGLSKGYGFVQMMDVEQAMSAIAAVHGNMVEGSTKPLVCKIAGDRNTNNNDYPMMGVPYNPLTTGDDDGTSAAAYFYQQQQQYAAATAASTGVAYDPSAYYGGMQNQSYAIPEGIQIGDQSEAPDPPPPPPTEGTTVGGERGEDLPPPPPPSS